MADVMELWRTKEEMAREAIPKPGITKQPEATDKRILEDIRWYFQLVHQWGGLKLSLLGLKFGLGIQARLGLTEGEEGFRVKESLSMGALKLAAAAGGEKHQPTSELEAGFNVGKFGPKYAGKWRGGERVPTEEKFSLFGAMMTFFGMGIGAEFELRRGEQTSVLFEEPLILHTQIQAGPFSIQPRVNLSNLVDKLVER
jgi:hypothetical protein